MPKDPFETDLVQGAKDYLRAFFSGRDRPQIEKATQAYLQSLLEKYMLERAADVASEKDAASTASDREEDETEQGRRRQRKRRIRMLLSAFNEGVEGRRLR